MILLPRFTLLRQNDLRVSMPDDMKCHLCDQVFDETERLATHLIDKHQGSVQDYLNRKVVVTECPRRGCDAIHDTKNLTPLSICSCGYPIGHWAYRWAASFIVASVSQR